VAGDTVYVAGHGWFFALDAADGRPRWRKLMNWNSRTQPLVANGLLHYVNGSRYLRTLDAATGRRRWRVKYKRKGWNDSAPVLADGTLYAVDDRGTVRAFDPATGAPRWQRSTFARWPATPMVHDGTLYLGGLGADVYALDAATGKRRWQEWPGSQNVNSVRTTPSPDRLRAPVVAVRARSGSTSARLPPTPTSLPEATPGQHFRYRYRGLRLLAQSGDRMFLIPKDWTWRDGDVLVVPPGSGVRVAFHAAERHGPFTDSEWSNPWCRCGLLFHL
jgi:hypothetical protein